ncbi:AN1-type zinc finger protein 3-like [Periophthalmus magnuspinnatus]|uniref:AN1-type zinc finger protein 3-like n=1 Tax=Periophthalmus magnuspinnatus TaxID=409849 RepID=UPI00145BD44C|nr:AN1-type zinc finger protein 3-like [Periophthalmus magnuspinnatus]
MGDTSERSKASTLPPRCPCGFWGSSKTMNLCSKCFADIQKKQPGEECSSKPLQSSGSGASVFSADPSTSSPPSPSPSSSSPSSSPSISSTSPSSSQPGSSSEASAAPESPLSSREGTSSTDTAQGTLCNPTKRPRESAADTDSEATPEKRSRMGDKDDGFEGGSTPKQKNRRRCFRCQTKLELVQQELGSCRCGYVFCMLHRLPEQHDCLFDHLGRGREEAVLKMVKLDRKVGRSCQRIGEECS